MGLSEFRMEGLVRPSIIYGFSAFSFRLGAERSKY